jgi:ribosomal protein S18 acetylase RimI-like enzyme
VTLWVTTSGASAWPALLDRDDPAYGQAADHTDRSSDQVQTDVAAKPTSPPVTATTGVPIAEATTCGSATATRGRVSGLRRATHYADAVLRPDQGVPLSVIETVAYDHADVARLTEEVQAYYVRIYGGPDTAPVDPAEFAPPSGSFFVGYRAGEPVTMGGWRFVRSSIDIPASRPAEIKRMYVVESARGLGLAREMLRHLEVSASVAGADALALETGLAQPAAVALYRSSGYSDIPRFGHYRDKPDAVHLGKMLPRP